MFGYVESFSYISRVIERDMNHLLIEIGKLSEKLVLQMMSEGMNNDSAQDAVLVILKEHMEVGNTSTENCRECIGTLKMMLNN